MMEAQVIQSKPFAGWYMQLALWCTQRMPTYACSRHTPSVRNTVSTSRIPLHRHAQMREFLSYSSTPKPFPHSRDRILMPHVLGTTLHVCWSARRAGISAEHERVGRLSAFLHRSIEASLSLIAVQEQENSSETDALSYMLRGLCEINYAGQAPRGKMLHARVVRPKEKKHRPEVHLDEALASL